MARPKKDNAEYFPHEAGMRNDDRVKALRKKYKLQGYAIWNMLIEYLAGKENFRFEYNDFTMEIIAGDFDAEVPDIQNVISYCLTLGLLQQEEGFIVCKRLEKGLQPLLSKRKRDRDKVIASENPQSKGENSKGEERKVKQSEGENGAPADDEINPRGTSDKNKIFEEIFSDELFISDLVRNFPKANLEVAWDQCWVYHSQTPSPPEHGWQWRQKLTTWLGIERDKKNGISKTTQRTDATNARREAFAKRYGAGAGSK